MPYTSTSSTNVPAAVVSAEYWIWPTARRDASLLVIHCTAASASRAGQLDLAHVADVEQPGARADGQVLVGDAGVFDGHVPAAELDHASAGRPVPGVEWSLLERRRAVSTTSPNDNRTHRGRRPVKVPSAQRGRTGRRSDRGSQCRPALSALMPSRFGQRQRSTHEHHHERHDEPMPALPASPCAAGNFASTSGRRDRDEDESRSGVAGRSGQLSHAIPPSIKLQSMRFGV